jgi:hypothetical protein
MIFCVFIPFSFQFQFSPVAEHEWLDRIAPSDSGNTGLHQPGEKTLDPFVLGFRDKAAEHFDKAMMLSVGCFFSTHSPLHPFTSLSR